MKWNSRTLKISGSKKKSVWQHSTTSSARTQIERAATSLPKSRKYKGRALQWIFSMTCPDGVPVLSLTSTPKKALPFFACIQKL